MCSSFAAATTVVVPTFEELVAKSDVIFEGSLIATEAKWVGQGDSRRIQTDYTFKVIDAMKGNVPELYKLQVLGGTVGDVTLKVEGFPDFSRGERVILFITQNGVQFIPLVGIMHGHYRIKRDAVDDQEIVINHNNKPLLNVNDIGHEQLVKMSRIKSSKASSKPLSVKEFKKNIRDKKLELER